jgi:hypothetical protein
MFCGGTRDRFLKAPICDNASVTLLGPLPGAKN